MTDNDFHLDRYEAYSDLFERQQPKGQSRRGRWKAHYEPKMSRSEILSTMTDDLTDVELSFETTYRPSRHEQGWLLSSLYSFYDQGLITDVLALVKGGKEASVYCCEAHPATGLGLLAAKVYRPRMFRSLRNDSLYRQGREILTPNGRPAGMQSDRIAHAIQKKSTFGLQAAHTSWLMHEYTAMEKLYDAGGAVPRPIAASENAILMGYHGDERMAAPTLNTVRLADEEVEPLFRELMRNVDLMLRKELVHGDLSAFNILYWQGGLTLIDFPQVVNLHTNEHARPILERDIERTCQYFSGHGLACKPKVVADELWSRYVEPLHLDDQVADWSRVTMDPPESEDEAGTGMGDETVDSLYTLSTR